MLRSETVEALDVSNFRPEADLRPLGTGAFAAVVSRK